MRLSEGAFNCKFGEEVLDKVSERLEVRKYEARRRKQVRVKVASDTVWKQYNVQNLLWMDESRGCDVLKVYE